MSADSKRWQLIAVVAAAAVVNAVATHTHSRILGWIGVTLLFVSVALFLRWRRRRPGRAPW